MAKKATFIDHGQGELIAALVKGLDVTGVPAQPSGSYLKLQVAGKTVFSIHPRKYGARVFIGGASTKDAVTVKAGESITKIRTRLEKLVAEAAATSVTA